MSRELEWYEAALRNYAEVKSRPHDELEYAKAACRLEEKQKWLSDEDVEEWQRIHGKPMMWCAFAREYALLRKEAERAQEELSG